MAIFDAMKKIALVGCGSIAKRHVANIAKAGTLVAVCDLVAERANALALAHGATAYTALEEMLATEKETELLVVCTPNGLHAEHCIKALQAGKDVLTEKPLCLTTAAAWQLIETEKYCRRRLYLVQSMRYNPLVQQVKQLLSQGSLGRVYSFHLSCLWHRPDSYFTEWKGKLFPDGGLLYNQFSHYLDVLYWLFGEVEEARGFSANTAHPASVEFEDTGTAALRMGDGVHGTLHWSVNAALRNCEIGLTIVAEKATLRLGGEYLNEVYSVQAEAPVSLRGFRKGDVDFHAALYDEFALAMKEQVAGFPGAFDGLHTIEAVEKIYKAVR